MLKIIQGLKNASYLAIGKLLTQIISFVGFVYIARMLGPDDYGIYTIVGAFVGLFTLFTFTGLNKVVLREGSKDISEMHRVLENTVGIRNIFIILSICLCIVASFFTPYDLQVKLYIILFSAELAYTGIDGFLSTIFQASERMQYPALFGISNKVIIVVLSVVFLYLGYGLLSLFLIRLFSHFIIIIGFYRVSKRFVSFKFFSRPRINKELIKPAITFSLLALVALLASQIDLVMISFLGTKEDVGIYGVSYNIARQSLMLRGSFSIAFFPVAVKRFQNRHMMGRTLIKYSTMFFIAILAISVVIFFYAEMMITFLFGNEYKESGEILRVLIFYLCFGWSAVPFESAAQATHNEKLLLISRSIMAGLNIPLNYIFFLWYGLIGIAYSTLVVFSLGNSILCTSVFRTLKRQGHLV